MFAQRCGGYRPGAFESKNVSDSSDEELVERSQRGEQTAFRELVERYQRRLFSVAFGMVRNRDDAMDLVQDAFIKIYRHMDGFQGSSSFYTWIYRITLNLCIDYLRKRARHYEVDYDDAQRSDLDDDDPIVPSTMGINPAKVYQRKELLEQMERAIQSLSEKHRSIILLREVQGLSYTEIAEVLQISKGTVMSRLHHARRNLQEALEQYLQGAVSVD
jgi:RNA polymerase sigma-70 factor (ECF subfamily)